MPWHIDVIKHPLETDGKSTAIHAAVLAPESVTMYTYPDFPDYNLADGVNLIESFPHFLFVLSRQQPFQMGALHY